MDEETLAGVIGRCFPEFTVKTHRVLGKGWDSVALEVNGEYIFRFLVNGEMKDNLEKEIRLLPELEKRLPIRIPHFDFIWSGGTEHELPFVGYKKIEGVPLGSWCPASPHADKLARQFADFLSELHRFPMDLVNRLGVIRYDTNQWRERFQALLGKVRERVFPLLDIDSRRRVADFLEEHISNPANFSFTPVLMHDDLAGEHILCDRIKGEITGIIDWTDASVGDPALDFTGVLDDCGADFARNVLSVYRGRDDYGILERAAFYSKIVPFYEILHGLDVDESTLRYGLEHLRVVLPN